MYWWIELGYPDAFDVGGDGKFPRPGQVVRYYRERKMDNKGKAWTQKGLAKTLGISDNAVRDIENRDAGMDDIGRRQFLCKLFGIPPILLGIVSHAEIDALVESQQNAHKTVGLSTPLATGRKHMVDIKEYAEELRILWTTKKSAGHSSMLPTALVRIDALYREVSHVTQERTQMHGLLCDYHQFVANLLCECGNYDEALTHLNKAFGLAEVLDDERKALVFKRRGNTLWIAHRLDEAVKDFEGAWQFEKHLSPTFRADILLESSRARAQHATTKQEQTSVLRSLDVVGTTIRANRREEDPHLFQLDRDCYHLYKSAALIAIGWNKEATQELSIIDDFSHHRLRQVYYDILQSQAYIQRGMYETALPLLESALTTAQEVHSTMNIARVVTIFQQLQNSPYKDSTDVARIAYLLHKKANAR